MERPCGGGVECVNGVGGLEGKFEGARRDGVRIREGRR